MTDRDWETSIIPPAIEQAIHTVIAETGSRDIETILDGVAQIVGEFYFTVPEAKIIERVGALR